MRAGISTLYIRDKWETDQMEISKYDTVCKVQQKNYQLQNVERDLFGKIF